MNELFLTAVLIPSVWAGILCLIFGKTWGKRLKTLARELAQCSDAMCQMAEMQMKAHKKVTDNLGDIEERLLDLSVPSPDAAFPLERRHQVLALANQGMALEEISGRLNVPRGEAELILGLRKYMAGAPSRSTKVNHEVMRHVHPSQ